MKGTAKKRSLNDHLYHGSLFLVDKSGTSLISPTAVRLVPSAGPSQDELIPMDAKVKPTPSFHVNS